MGFSKLSVTIPNEIYRDIKKYSLEKNVKVSHLVADARAELEGKVIDKGVHWAPPVVAISRKRSSREGRSTRKSISASF